MHKVLTHNAYIPVLAPPKAHSCLLFQTPSFLVCKTELLTGTRFTLPETTRTPDTLRNGSLFTRHWTLGDEKQWSLGNVKYEVNPRIPQLTLWRGFSRPQCREGDPGRASRALRWRGEKSCKSSEAKAVRIAGERSGENYRENASPEVITYVIKVPKAWDSSSHQPAWKMWWFGWHMAQYSKAFA